jgi:hypothetical protein
LLDVDGYLRGQSSWLVNYAKRYRADLRVGTSITEGTANFLVNRRMNKSQPAAATRQQPARRHLSVQAWRPQRLRLPADEPRQP